jgi:hypothetical protein
MRKSRNILKAMSVYHREMRRLFLSKSTGDTHAPGITRPSLYSLGFNQENNPAVLVEGDYHHNFPNVPCTGDGTQSTVSYPSSLEKGFIKLLPLSNCSKDSFLLEGIRRENTTPKTSVL